MSLKCNVHHQAADTIAHTGNLYINTKNVSMIQYRNYKLTGSSQMKLVCKKVLDNIMEVYITYCFAQESKHMYLKKWL
jgi:hypothetical protein